MIPNYMATAFKGLGAEFSKQVVRAPTGQNFIIGGGGAGVLLTMYLTASIPEDTLKNDSPYARRYLRKYREYNAEQVAKEHAAQH
mmetsp:Transcript_6303/g.9959  ORF Transcript_6303/g.9959 Transcript_6303/m.9959 type:complete len:85 (+) Transcript_6303:58-312(+)